MLIRVHDEHGVAILRDSSVSCPVPAPLGKNRHYSTLEAASRRGDLFFIDGEDPIDLSLELMVEGHVPPGIAPLYEAVGGTFLLRAPSGRLALSGLESWVSGVSTSAAEVRPGNYALTVLSQVTYDLTEHRKKLKETVGDANWTYKNKVDKLALAGCLPTLAAAIALYAPPWRRYTLYLLPVAVFSWLPHWLLRSTKRYRSIERREAEFEASLPRFILILAPIEDARALVGGHLTTS
jgi:hypothetical protein